MNALYCFLRFRDLKEGSSALTRYNQDYGLLLTREARHLRSFRYRLCGAAEETVPDPNTPERTLPDANEKIWPEGPPYECRADLRQPGVGAAILAILSAHPPDKDRRGDMKEVCAAANVAAAYPDPANALRALLAGKGIRV